MILIVIVLALLTGVYVLTLASFAWEDIVLGLSLAAVLLAVHRRVLLPHRLQPVGRTVRAVVMFPLFAIMSIREIILGSITVAALVIGIRKLEHPGIVAVPIGDRTPTGVGMSSMILTMSPGSFLVDVDWDERVMYIHVIDASDPDKVRSDLQAFYERYQRHVVP
jgi:multisubunit Na+/H+ antiporter MnhE subunit